MAFQIRITTGSPSPIYKQITDQVRHAIAIGALTPGDLLPSVRALAENLVLNPNTVAHAYSDLVRDGTLESSPGKGLTVAKKRQIFTKAERLRRLEPALSAFLHEALALDFGPTDMHDVLDRKLAEFAARTPPLSPPLPPSLPPSSPLPAKETTP